MIPRWRSHTNDIKEEESKDSSTQHRVHFSNAMPNKLGAPLRMNSCPCLTVACQHDSPALVSEVKAVVKVFGWRVFQVALGLTFEEVRVQILAAVLGVLPASLLPLVPT